MLEVLLFKRLGIYFIPDFFSNSTLVYGGITNRSSRIVCIGVRWNQIGQVGGAPGVGSASSQLIPEVFKAPDGQNAMPPSALYILVAL